VGQPQSGENVETVHAILRIEIGFGECAARAESGVVDEQFKVVRRAQASFDAVHVVIDGEVGGKHFAAEFVRDGIQAVAAAGD
jgi:hypothetical protein